MTGGFYLSLLMGGVLPAPVPKFLVDALWKVQVTSSTDQRSGFQVSFLAGKSSPILQYLLPSGFFDPPSRVILLLTMNGRSTTIMDGVITRHELAPSDEPGQTSLTLTGLDVSQVMDLVDLSGFPWWAMPAEAQVALILARYAVYGIIPIIVPSPLVFVPNPLDTLPSQRGTDYAHIRKLADDTGYVFYVEPGPTPGTNFAYWGPEIKVGKPQPALSINMDANTNVESLSFSFDGLAKSVYVMFVQNQATKVPIPIPIPDITPLNPPLGLKQPFPLSVTFLNRPSELEDDTSKYDVVQAAARGLARASQSSDVITGSGSLDVLRYGHILKARGLVGVRGAGIAYDGLYFVKSVSHNIKRGEYKQNFSLSRNAFIPFTRTVGT
jgi:hypothetical protein